MKITVAVSASKSEGEHMDEARRLAIGAEVSSSETQLSGLSSSLVPSCVVTRPSANLRSVVQVMLHGSSHTLPPPTHRPESSPR